MEKLVFTPLHHHGQFSAIEGVKSDPWKSNLEIVSYRENPSEVFETMEKDPHPSKAERKRKFGRTIGEKERMKHTERYHSANGSREIVEGRFKDSNRTARQTKQNRAEAGIN